MTAGSSDTSGEIARKTADDTGDCSRGQFSAAEVARIDGTVADLLTLLGRAHTMAILRVFADESGPLRFSEIESALGISPNTLSERLKELTATGLLTRSAYNEIPPRVEYAATDRAEALFPVFGHLADWARSHELDTLEA
ncbi:winged helix-turn-helix transcriptional regulator [Salinirubrum litoreum]|uniref:Winged helix-turn-helix transcriptional regulator n=1 Tax=Salinirubrum litoreum TaxID=1126234 RepID=A0ABD5REF7_9EURY|nr:helix-turn-helix domain-containing protein [Salinirubrum litoreum]